MNTKLTRTLTMCMWAGLFVFQLSPAYAQFIGAGAQATNWFVLLVTPFIPFACAAVGVACFTGRVNWGWFLAAVCGTALFFGRNQVITLFRAWLGV